MTLTSGFKALAYPAPKLSESASPRDCSLVFRSDQTRATILLVVKLGISDDAETCVLQYDADRLSSGHVQLSNGNNDPALQPQLGGLLRTEHDGRPQIKTLAMTLQQPVPVWRSGRKDGAHAAGMESSRQQFVDLVRATKVYVVFDYKFLPQEHRSAFKAFSKAAKDLTGYPVGRNLTGLRFTQASWTDFSPIDAAGAPPAYANPLKRPLQPSSPPSQSCKRSVLQSPTRSHTSDATVPDSPATAEALSATFLHTKAIDTAVMQQLPTQLRNVLPSLLPVILPALFVVSPDAELSMPTSFDSHTTSSPELPPLTPLGRALLPHLRDHLNVEFQQEQTRLLRRFRQLLDTAQEKQAQAAVETEEYLEDHRIDLRMTKEDTLQELAADVDALFAKGRQECLDLHDELTGVFQSVFGDLCDRIKTMMRFGLKRIVASEVRKHERRRRGKPRRVGKGVVKSTVKSDQKLLGRKRDVDREDC